MERVSAPTPSAEELAHLFDTVVGVVTLRASDTGAVSDFYERAIGLEPRRDGTGIVELADREGRTLIRLDSSAAAGSEPFMEPHTGLFHNAFRYPDRAALGAAVKRAVELAPVFEGASDHGVSDAVYFRDPEGNGVELYRDRPYDEWPVAGDGGVGMYTRPLDLAALLAEADDDGLPARCDIGHIHLQTADVDRAASFWRDALGLDERQRFGPQAVFIAEGLYHHHIGANTWHSAGADPAPPDRPGLDSFELRLRSAERVDAAAARLEEAGTTVVAEGDHVSFEDPDRNRVLIRAREPR
jgi:catechol 2,3-dioxygenase